MPDLYQVLGLSRSASVKEIRSAYRKRAKTAHPDVGGRKEDFELLQLAHDTLVNDELRKHYDATGEVKTKEIDQGRAQVIQLIAQLLDHVMNESAQRGIEITQLDLIGALVMALGKQREHQTNQINALEKRRKQYNRVLKRFKRADDKENMMESVIMGNLSGIEQNVRTISMQKALVGEALKIVNEHTFERDKIETGGTSTGGTGAWIQAAWR